MNTELERGMVLEVSDIITIKEDYTVLYHSIPVGSAKDNLSWFTSNPRKIRHNEIKKIVYLGNYKWGVKELTSPIEEFESFDKTTKEQILHDFLEMQEKYLETQKKYFELLEDQRY